jgi:hypothetical protein
MFLLKNSVRSERIKLINTLKGEKYFRDYPSEIIYSEAFNYEF